MKGDACGGDGAAEVPEGVSGETAASVEGAVAESFVAGFWVATVAAAILAVASAVASALIIEGKGSVQRIELETQMEHEAQTIADIALTADAREGIAAFTEK